MRANQIIRVAVTSAAMFFATNSAWAQGRCCSPYPNPYWSAGSTLAGDVLRGQAALLQSRAALAHGMGRYLEGLAEYENRHQHALRLHRENWQHMQSIKAQTRAKRYEEHRRRVGRYLQIKRQLQINKLKAEANSSVSFHIERGCTVGEEKLFGADGRVEWPASLKRAEFAVSCRAIEDRLAAASRQLQSGGTVEKKVLAEVREALSRLQERAGSTLVSQGFQQWQEARCFLGKLHSAVTTLAQG